MYGMILLVCIIAPYLIGCLYNSRKEYAGISENWVVGTLISFSVYFVISIVITLVRLPLTVLTSVYLVFIAILSVVSLVKRCFMKSFARPKIELIGVVNMLLILVQILAVTFLSHTDMDDSWYVATSVTDWFTNTVGVYNPYTGYETNWASQSQYLFATWPVFGASLAQVSPYHPTIILHSIIPSVMVGLNYAMYWMASGYLFDGEGDRFIERKRFMLFINALYMTAMFSTRAASAFLLLRPWQGKAGMISIFLPFLFVLCYEFTKKPEFRNWLLICMCCATVCFFSSMGVVLGGLVVGICGLMTGIINKSWKNMFAMWITLIPNLAIGLIFLKIS